MIACSATAEYNYCWFPSLLMLFESIHHHSFRMSNDKSLCTILKKQAVKVEQAIPEGFISINMFY